MDWSVVQDALQDWFADATGLDVVWMNQMRPNNMKPYGVLQITSTNGVGIDELHYDYDIGSDAVVPTVSGVRLLTLNCQVISRNQNANLDAINYLEKARTSLRNPSFRAALQAAGLGFLGALGTVVLDKVFDKRWESRASMDIRFNLAENITYSDIEESYIERVEMDADYVDVIDPAIEFVDEIFGVPV